jgi:hypothetical protein
MICCESIAERAVIRKLVGPVHVTVKRDSFSLQHEIQLLRNEVCFHISVEEVSDAKRHDVLAAQYHGHREVNPGKKVHHRRIDWKSAHSL